MSIPEADEAKTASFARTHPAGEVGVDACLLADLATSYAAYRQSLGGTFDPVATLARTGDVLRSVRTILTAPNTQEQHQHLQKFGKV